MSRHTKETCFKLVGYPDWWEDGHKKSTGQGKPVTVVGNLVATINSKSVSRGGTGIEGGTSVATHESHRRKSEEGNPGQLREKSSGCDAKMGRR